jgi:hypothetical protein
MIPGDKKNHQSNDGLLRVTLDGAPNFSFFSRCNFVGIKLSFVAEIRPPLCHLVPFYPVVSLSVQLRFVQTKLRRETSGEGLWF